MADPERLSLRVAYPVPTPRHGALLASYELLLDQAATYFEVRVRARGQLFFEDWETTRAALLARMAGTLRHLGYLAPSSSRLDGAALARTLIEHVITFAWISGDPAARLPRFLRSSFSKALDKDREFRQRGDTLLDDALRDRYRAYVRAHTDDMLGLRNQASEADAAWLERVRANVPAPLQIPSLVELYDLVYDGYANLDHPSVTALQVFVHTDTARSEIVVDGAPERDWEADMRPYWLAAWSFIWALMVSSLATGRPRLGPLNERISQIRAIREFDRHDLLDVTEGDGGMVISVVPDADARIEEIARARDSSDDAPAPP